jgi:hypothetical protein
MVMPARCSSTGSIEPSDAAEDAGHQEGEDAIAHFNPVAPRIPRPCRNTPVEGPIAPSCTSTVQAAG